MIVNIGISLGELVDKISILEIKKKNINKINHKKLITQELILLKKTLHRVSKNNLNIKKYLRKLININLKLWNIEDGLRECERKKKFDMKFIELARAVYFTNDERSKIKYEINRKFGSTIVEVKSYKKY